MGRQYNVGNNPSLRGGKFKMNLLCRHHWKMLSETITTSELEEASRILGNHHDITEISGNMMARKCIQIVACDKCGQLKRFCEEI